MLTPDLARHLDGLAPRLDVLFFQVDALAIARRRLSGEAFTEGIETVVLDGAPVRVYSSAKTITDCFKLRSKVGLDVALEAVREAWGQRKVTMDNLWRTPRSTG